MKRYRLIGYVHPVHGDTWRVQRRWLGIWWPCATFHTAHEARDSFRRYVEACSPPTVLYTGINEKGGLV